MFVNQDISAGSVPLIKKAPPRKEDLEINEAILELIALTHGEVVKNGVSLHTGGGLAARSRRSSLTATSDRTARPWRDRSIHPACG
jgi:hypothetical protein